MTAAVIRHERSAREQWEKLARASWHHAGVIIGKHRRWHACAAGGMCAGLSMADHHARRRAHVERAS